VEQDGEFTAPAYVRDPSRPDEEVYVLIEGLRPSPRLAAQAVAFEELLAYQAARFELERARDIARAFEDGAAVERLSLVLDARAGLPRIWN
jgi:hypothetical protein